MKCSENWLREWVNPPITSEDLATKLTMSGLEVEEVAQVSTAIKKIVVGQIKKSEAYPDTKLSICAVDVGRDKYATIVCGASNAKEDLKVAVALPGALLPDGKVIEAAKVHGLNSEGMLLSAHELGLSDESDALLELPADAPIGKTIWDYYELNDNVFDVSITPNRGDCLSIKGLAREVAAVTEIEATPITVQAVKASASQKISIQIKTPEKCPRYVGRIIKNVSANSLTPIWLKERLRRSGVRSISPIVDVTNYVMMELGQPMHAFDLSTIDQGIIVRNAKQGEKINLLDGSEQTLDADTLVIADHQKPLAIAGVMGGMDSSVTLLTTDILLESAYFSPQAVARQRQHYNLTSESAYRFERGIDPSLQVAAIERATELILAIAGGEACEVVESTSNSHLPQTTTIELLQSKLNKVLGLTIEDKQVAQIFKRLGFDYQVINKGQEQGWQVSAPTYRHDLQLPEDLIEEVARIFGYDKIPSHHIVANITPTVTEEENDFTTLRNLFSALGFHEIVSYSFIDNRIQKLVDPETEAITVVNPITLDMTVMRTNLWAGLLTTFLYNRSRQQPRIKLFEIGNSFTKLKDQYQQNTRIAGLCSGLAFPEQWGFPQRNSDFFDLKGAIETVLKLELQCLPLRFEKDEHPALHPGQTAAIYAGDQKIGMMGTLHPVVGASLGIEDNLVLFEIDLNLIKSKEKVQIKEISKFPEIRRDIAIVVNQAIPTRDIQDTIKKAAGDWLTNVFTFDVYQGKGIEPGYKSIALGLIFQHPTRTLVDSEVADLTERVIKQLQDEFGAELRR